MKGLARATLEGLVAATLEGLARATLEGLGGPGWSDITSLPNV